MTGKTQMTRTLTTHKAKSDSINHRIDDFIKRLQDAPQKGDRVASLVRNELRWLGVESNELRYSLRTTKAYITRYRRAVAENLELHDTFISKWEKLVRKFPELADVDIKLSPREIEHEIIRIKSGIKDKTTGLYDSLHKLKICHRAYYLIKLRDGQSATVKDDDREKVITKKKDKTLTISKRVAKTVVAENLKYDGEIIMYRRAVALMLCCGRRPAELFKTARFEKVSDSSVRFFGQIKGKAKAARNGYEIPIMFVSADDFLESFDDFRKATLARGFGGLTNTQVNTRIGADISKSARRMLLNNDAVLYTCRSVYANLAAELNPDADRDLYMAEILGHEHDDLNTVNSYQGIALTNDAITTCMGSYREAIKKTRKRVEPLGKKKPKPEPKPVTPTNNRRAVAFAKMQGEADNIGRAVSALHTWAVEYLKSYPDAVFTQTMITRLKPTSRPAIQKWLALVDGK